MSALSVAEQERGMIRVFALDMPERDLARLTDPGKTDPSPQATVAMLVGLDWLEEGGFEIFETDMLGELGLAGYLRDGGGVAEETLATAKMRLNAYDGPVLILYSRAFGGKPATLTPGPGVTHLGSFAEESPPVIYEKLPSAAAKGAPVSGAAPEPTKANPHLNVLLAILALPLAAIIIGLILYGVFK